MAGQSALVAIARRRGGPVAVRFERTADFDWTGDPVAAAALVARRVPLRVVEGAVRDPAVAEVRRAWTALSAARVAPDSIAALLLVLVRTTLDEPVPSGVARFDGAEPPPPFRPTAAHPRAYEGTGARPPKRSAPRRFDLQAVALDPRASRALVEQFPREVAGALALLAEPDRERAARLLGDEPEGAAAWDGAALPPPFRLLVWPLLRWTPGDPTARVLGELRRHGPVASSALATAAGWWLARGSGPGALPWLHAALALPPELAEVALFVCAEAGATDLRADAVPLHELAAAAGHDRERFALELWTLLDGWARGVAPRLLLPGVELLRDAGRPRALAGARPVELVPADAIRDLAGIHTGERWRGMGVDLWRALSRAPGLAAVVLAQPWAAVDETAAEELLGAIAWWWPREDAAHREVGAWWAERLPEMVALVRDRPPAYAAKLADAFAEVAYLFYDAAGRRALWPWLTRVATRLAAPPFRPDVRSASVWYKLVQHPPVELRQAIIDAPDRAWIELERRSRVPAQAWLLARGLDSFGQADGARLAEAFLARTPLLYEVATMVGGMSDSSSTRVCDVGPDSDGPLAWLERIRARALADLAGGLDLDVSQPRVRHALVMQRSLIDNRRALRKFLRAHSDGDADYVRRHPLTLRWLAAHPVADAARWMSGIALEATVDGIGPLTLRLETDPLEALRLGTYVGSCLSVGGAFDYAAVAVALDVNKQVVYARNRRGSVIARQLLALSEADELVTFAVYPLSTPAAVKRLFARYDRAFATALGLTLRGGDGDYTIADVISSRWWDDGPWLSTFASG